LDAVEATLSFLAANREAGERCFFTSARTFGIRVWAVRGFRNHLVFYRPTEQGIDVVRVLHGARDIEALFQKSGG
jgi:toxin ParE1/3/4